MHKVQKVWKASDRRRTRFHTERGQLMPASAWARLPRSVWARLSGADPVEPWMVPAAVERLDELIQPTWSVLEFGSGASTAWYAARAARVVSLEDDASWYEGVRTLVRVLASRNCDLRLVAVSDFPTIASEFPPGAFDLVVVDCNEAPGVSRADCAAAARPLIKSGGRVVVDDSDVPEFQPMLELFGGWEMERYVGVKHRPLMAVETSILRRPQTEVE